MNQVIWRGMLAMTICVFIHAFVITRVFPAIKRKEKLSVSLSEMIAVVLIYGACALVLFLFLKPLPKIQPAAGILKIQDYIIIFFAQFATVFLNIMFSALEAKIKKQKLSEIKASRPLLKSPVTLVLTIFIVPFMEELICRKILGDAALNLGAYFFIFLSAIIFGMMHILSGRLALPFSMFYLGLLYASLYALTGSLWIPVIYHILYNVLLTLVPEFIESMKKPSQAFYMLSLGILGLIASWRLYIILPHLFLHNEQSETVRRIILTHPAIFIYLLVSILTAFYLSRKKRADKNHEIN